MEKESKIYEPLLNIEEILPILNQIAIFGALNDNELYTLFQNLKKVKYKKGELICRYGTPAKYIYIIYKGRVKVYIEDQHTVLELIEFGIGKCFGETSLIGIQPHTANIIAEEDTELIVLSGKALHELFKSDMELFSKIILNIARETCRRLSDTDNILLHYVQNEHNKGLIN